ncbi:hypothetical protein NCC78_15310 [Micromonospora phytophila]|uniref:hypothetical protein n=1 Tax=Micromonospora phytophila TaxID=709888 RepID=UPI00202F0FAA|nr:hypothetical protein [Micromonospora phytophila]MCM0676048.1 hypothetical protein [Micromonospora phytophila]
MSIRRTVITLAAAAVLLAGCAGRGSGESVWQAPADNGVAALEPAQILERSKTALKGAKSYRIKGDVIADGKRMGLDLRISGDDVAGNISMDDASVELLSVGGKQYMRPDEKFWEQNVGAEAAEQMTKLMGDRWSVVPERNKDFADLFGVTNLDNLFEADGTVVKGETKDIGGAQAVALIDEGGKGGTLWVATIGEPYPVRVESKETGQGQITLNDFGTTFPQLKAPTEDQVVDLEKFKGK